MLEKPKEYKSIEAQQNNDTIYAEDINQIISNIELIKGGSSNEAPAGNIKELKADLTSEENARKNADANLQNNLEKEIQNRETEDDNIKNNIIGDLTTLKTTDKNNIVNAINETYDKASQVNILEGQPYYTGNTFNGMKIMKVMWQDIKNNATKITDTLEGKNILDTKVFGNSKNEITDISTGFLIFPCPYLVNSYGTWKIFTITISIIDNRVYQDSMDFDNLDEIFQDYIKAIEITYLE